MVTDLDEGLLVEVHGWRAPWSAHTSVHHGRHRPVCPPVPPDGAVGVLKADPAATPLPALCAATAACSAA